MDESRDWARDHLAEMIDHTFLKSHGDAGDIERLCGEAKAYGFAMVAVNPAEIARCRELLEGTPVHVGAAVGFPLGQNTTEVKFYEIEDAIRRGAQEIDMVLNQRALHEGDFHLVQRELEGLSSLCQEAGVISKVILETCTLCNSEKRIACEIAKDAEVDFVKTSTGFGDGGATVEDVALMRDVVGPDMGVKAAGGIRTLESALAMVQAGANRLGTSNSVAIMEETLA